ncbi:MAG: adenylate/guanylate cyclase domain-containing protein [Pseudomonadota bacterium]
MFWRGWSQRNRGILISRLAGLILLISLLIIRIVDPVLVANLRNQGFDFLQRLSPRPEITSPVVIVDIDESSLESFGQWPWPRTRVAEIVEKLTRLGAVTIGFDIIFAEEDRLSPPRVAEDNPKLPEVALQALKDLPQNEEALVAAMKNSRVVLGESSRRLGQWDDPSKVKERKTEPRKIPHAQLGEDPAPFLLQFPQLVQNVKEINDAAAGLGIVNVLPDVDNIFRKVPLVVQAEGTMRMALSAEAIRIATGGRAFAVRTDAAGVSSIIVGGVEIPTDQNASIWPWFNASSRDRYVSAGDILNDAVEQQKVRGKIALLGTSAVGLEDYRATPIASSMPGVEIHAQVIENILTQSFLIRPNFGLGMELVFVAVVGLLIIWIVPLLGAIYSGVAAVLTLGAFAGGSLWAFYSERLLIDGVFPVGALAVLFGLMTMANYIREEVEKRQIRGAFGQYLSPALVDQLSEDPELLVLGGQTKELTLLFTDIRGFTGISESYKKNPQGLTRLMNRFLNTLSAPILEEEGTIDKYMGDAIMAFWNAPLALEDHEFKACRAAIKMRDRLEELNNQRYEELKDSDDEPWHEFRIGIGINTGQSVVGNMGSDLRFDYTALGDTVNLASRLEGQSKPYGFQIIMGDSTAKAVEDRLAVFEIDLIRVKGKTEPERIHVLLGDETLRETEDFRALRAMNSMMLSAYHNQNWTTAFQSLDEMGTIAERMGLADTLSGYLFIYETRISEFRANPPGKSWDGVYDALTK